METPDKLIPGYDSAAEQLKIDKAVENEATAQKIIDLLLLSLDDEQGYAASIGSSEFKLLNQAVSFKLASKKQIKDSKSGDVKTLFLCKPKGKELCLKYKNAENDNQKESIVLTFGYKLAL